MQTGLLPITILVEYTGNPWIISPIRFSQPVENPCTATRQCLYMKSPADKAVFPMNINKTQWTKRFDFSMLSAWLVLSLILAFTAFVWFGVDFRGYYAAVRVLMAGGNPYDYRLVAQVLLDVTGEMGNNPYYYPPWFAWLFIPLTYLPFQIARIIWMAVNVLIWNIGLWQLGKIIGWPPKGWKLYAL